MTGLDKIISEIMLESENEVKEILCAAHEETQKISEAAKAQCEAITREAREAATQKVEELGTGFKTALDTQNRRATLIKKQSLIAETLQKAKAALHDLPDGEYFDFIIRLAAKSAQSGEGVIAFNARDRKRLPLDFEARLRAALPKDAFLAVSEDTLDIGGGFVLKYGEVAENCSIDALFDARADDFSDIVRSVLFGRRG